MGILEQVTEMKEKGTPDEEIVTTLRQQGYSPKEVKDALNQSQIKEAIYNPAPEEAPEQTQPSQYQQYSYPNPESSVAGGPSPPSPGGLYTPQTREVSEYPEEFYSPEEQVYGYEAGVSTETVIEISEQVFSEKIKKLQKRLNELSEYKTLSQTKIENLLDRVKRIESIIDKLQTAILEKIGSYGGTLEGIKKEMSMMQDSFGKILPRFAEKQKETKKTKKA